MAFEGDKPNYRGGSSLEDGFSDAITIAEELKAPLATIRQLALELESQMMTATDTAQLSEQIRLMSERSLRLVSNMTKAKHLQTQLFATAPLSVHQICQAVHSEIAPLYHAHDKQLILRRVQRMPLVIANYDLLRRVMLNFADNALQYSDDNGVIEIYMELLRTKQLVRIGVRDYGPALPTAVWRQLRREQAAAAHQIATRPDSSGLGLAFAGRFAAAMGGRIGAIRHRDGASFFVDVAVSKQLALL